MRVLITPNFNNSMRELKKPAQQEAVAFFSAISSMSKEQLANSALLTKLEKTEESLYTLRGNFVRIFCTFDSEDDIIFLDIHQAKDLHTASPTSQKNEVTLAGRNGVPAAYIATDDDSTIYSFPGEPLAYLDKDNIYGFNGKHLGWFEDGVIWDHKGRKVGFTKEASPIIIRLEPIKGFKRFKPFKSFKQFAPFKPTKANIISNEDLLSFLKKGSR